MTVAVIGSRGISRIDWPEIGIIRGDTLISGGARGADTLAASEARVRGIEVIEMMPNYKVHGRAATHIRNREIVNHSDRIVAFWDGKSNGTKSAVEYARRKGKDVKVVLCNLTLQ